MSLDKSQVKRLNDAIGKSYEQSFHKDGANNDQICAFVAPYIKTQEESFYVATIIMSNYFHAMFETGNLK